MKSSVLIVEDEGLIALDLKRKLEQAGYVVPAIADNAPDALRNVACLQPDLVLMDIRLRGPQDGIETADQIRRRFQVPVMFVTAHADRGTLERARIAEPFGYIVKPFHSVDFRAQIEMALWKQKMEQKLRTGRNAGEALIATDGEGNVTFMNASACRLTGRNWKEARGTPFREVFLMFEESSGLRPVHPFAAICEGCDFATEPRTFRLGNRSGDNQVLVEARFYANRDEASPVGIIAVFHEVKGGASDDATDIHLQEQGVRRGYKMEALGRLAAGIVHDFNNLLLVILGYTEELLRANAFKGGEQRAIVGIRRAGENGASLTRRLLMFVRDEPVERKEVSVNQVIRDTEELLRRMSGPDVPCEFRLDPNLGAVRADPGELKQLLMNLVTNARDAMPNGGRITIETLDPDVLPATLPAGPGSGYIAWKVTDTGAGMSPHTAAHLFDPCFTTKEPGQGTGLGLSIVHSIVTNLRGAIHVDSGSCGTTFTVYLPLLVPLIFHARESQPLVGVPGFPLRSQTNRTTGGDFPGGS